MPQRAAVSKMPGGRLRNTSHGEHLKVRTNVTSEATTQGCGGHPFMQIALTHADVLVRPRTLD